MGLDADCSKEADPKGGGSYRGRFLKGEDPIGGAFPKGIHNVHFDTFLRPPGGFPVGLTNPSAMAAHAVYSVVTWKEYSVEYTKTYRIPFQISSCIQCRNLYKDLEGYRAHGRRGQLLGMYSEDDLAGFCSIDCFYDAGGTFHENG
ncbi:hypothetical protein JOQ06_011192 [Pogonophryne albipinna]|uniref:CxC7-like cysteine cluster associated with KDZ transposases domain-containing protein n=1 Tax=Pogonophryne albipinna TaxID=1090488 RepID=A0AAD6AVE1_9TELE|nr:hypothetical protein JOQ06_011192 [Pogonophryne albipinna]